MKSRFWGRTLIVWHAARQSLHLLGNRRKPATPRRILVAHNLLLGDTVMLTPLLAKLRACYPTAEIVLTVQPGLLDLYRPRPYGVIAEPFSPRDTRSVGALVRKGGNFDLAIIPGDNRYALLARAMGARWIVANRNNASPWRNALCDELVAFPEQPTSVADIFTQLITSPAEWNGEFSLNDWPVSQDNETASYTTPYAVLHVGAGNPLRLLSAEKWLAIADWLQQRGITPVFSCGPNEVPLLRAIDPSQKFDAIPGTLNLSQLRAAIANSKLLVCLDSGISHLAKTTETPTVVIFGPGSPRLFGLGSFWRNAPAKHVWIEDMACRDQHTLFTETPQWVRRCGRRPPDCHENNRCMSRITTAQIIEACTSLLDANRH